MRFRQRSAVLLPHPDGPMNAVIVPFLIGMSTSRTALKLAVVELVDLAVDQRIRAVAAGAMAVSVTVAARFGHHREPLLSPQRSSERCARV